MTMTRAEIEALLDRLEDCIAEDLEGQHIDFKEWGGGGSREQLQRVVRAAVCMANGGGGTVVFGVADGVAGRARAVVGVPYHVNTGPLGAQVYHGTDPKLTPVFEEIEVPEGTRRLIVMHVHPGIPPYTDTAGRGTVRVGKDCLPLTGSLRRALNEESAGSDYTAETVEAPLSSVLSGAATEALREAAKRERASEALIARDDQDLLEAVGAADEGTPTRAAVLLAGSSAAMRRHVPRCLWTYVRMTSDTDYSERADGNDAIPLAVSGMIARIMSHNPIETVSEDIYDFEHPTYPRVALREAILNAFCHSDYRIASPRLVKQYADRIEITSPGGFLGGVTADNILHHRPVTRNPRLVDALVRLRMVNRTNLGTERMYRALLIEGKRPPVIEDIGGAVRVTFHASPLSVPFRSFVAAEERRGRPLAVDHLLVLNRLTRDREIGADGCGGALPAPRGAGTPDPGEDDGRLRIPGSHRGGRTLDSDQRASPAPPGRGRRAGGLGRVEAPRTQGHAPLRRERRSALGESGRAKDHGSRPPPGQASRRGAQNPGSRHPQRKRSWRSVRLRRSAGIIAMTEIIRPEMRFRGTAAAIRRRNATPNAISLFRAHSTARNAAANAIRLPFPHLVAQGGWTGCLRALPRIVRRGMRLEMRFAHYLRICDWKRSENATGNARESSLGHGMRHQGMLPGTRRLEQRRAVAPGAE